MELVDYRGILLTKVCDSPKTGQAMKVENLWKSLKKQDRFRPSISPGAQNILVENPSDSVKGLFNKDILCLRWSYAHDPCRGVTVKEHPSHTRRVHGKEIIAR